MIITEIYKDIFLSVLPLKNSPLRSLNLYIIKNQDGALIIDTGFNNPETLAAHQKIISELDLDLKNTRLYLTHYHSDHVGLANYFSDLDIPILTSPITGSILKHGLTKESSFWQHVLLRAKQQDLKVDLQALETHPGFYNRPKEPFPFIPVYEHQEIHVANYTLKIIDLNGHAPGMTGLYEPEHKFFFSADHILAQISPNITTQEPKYGNMLENYLKNLTKVETMDIHCLFPSHRFLIKDYKKRIQQLKAHHEERLKEIQLSLKIHPGATAYQIAAQMKWNIKYQTFDDFPQQQKWFAVGEAHAHLEHLVTLNLAKSETSAGVLHYTLL